MTVYRLPFQAVQDAVISRLRSQVFGVQVIEALRVHNQIPPKYILVGITSATPFHAHRQEGYDVGVVIVACKREPEGSGVDAEIYALADRIVAAMSAPLALQGEWAFIMPPWYESAAPAIIGERGAETAQVSLTYRIKVQRQPAA